MMAMVEMMGREFALDGVALSISIARAEEFNSYTTGVKTVGDGKCWIISDGGDVFVRLSKVSVTWQLAPARFFPGPTR